MPGNTNQSKKKVRHPPEHPPEHPPVTEHFFIRPAVEQLLQDAFKKPLTTVIAGAGYGKTQAVLSALSKTECSAAWIQLSELDNYAARLWERAARALEPWSSSLHDSLISIGYPKSIAVFDQFLKILERELVRKSPFILVLDDFHLIHNKAILNFVGLFISARVENFHLVLISRVKPDLSLSGMLSRGLLARVTEDDLRFSKDEMNDYLLTQGLELTESVISDIYSYTDGWVFAIYLVGMAAQKGDFSNLAMSIKLDIFDLIEKEIMAPASKELQDFLDKIVILETIPSGLIKVLAGHDLSLISEMLRMSMFIRYDPFSDSYRIHHLFRDFLLDRKGLPAKAELCDVHLAAAEWYKENDNKFEAIYHYRQISRFKEVFELIISIPGRVLYEEAESLVNLINQAPEDVIREMPIIRVAKAGYLFNNNKLDEAKLELSQLRAEYEARPDTEENRAVLGEVYLLQAVICLVNTDYTFTELFEMADARLPGGSRLVDYRTGMAEGVNACSISDPAAGELKRYQDALFHAAPYATRAMNGCCYGLEYLNAAESAFYTGDLKAAEKYAFEAIYNSGKYLQYDVDYMANFVLVRVFTAKGSYEKAAAILDQMKKQLETLHHADCISLYAVISGWFYAKLGKTDQVAGWIRYEEEARKILAPVVIGREYHVRSECLLEEERYYELLAFMDQTDRMYAQRGSLFAVIQNKIKRAIVHHYLGSPAESIHYLNEAYELAYPNDLVMLFIEYGNKMRTLIYSARQNKDCHIPGEWLDRIHTKSSSYAKMQTQLVSAYEAAHAVSAGNLISLSKRESEVLAYLNRGMTRKEIAATCYISLSTVNSILKNIYDKLGASNALEALRIAQEKNFI